MMTSLMLAVFVLILSLSLLALVQNDNRFQTSQEYVLRARYAANSALEVYRIRSEKFVPGGASMGGTMSGPANASFTQTWSVLITAAGDVRATGSVVSSGGQTMAMRTIVVPNSDFAQMYEVEGP